MLSIPPTLKYLEGFTVTGLSTRTQNSDEFNEKTAKLPGLWQQFYSSDSAASTTVFGVYSDYESDASGFYTVTAGVAGNRECPESNSVTIHEGNYLLFQGFGPMPGAVIEAWKRVWNYFASENQYQRNFMSDFEAYHGSDEVRVSIGVVARISAA